MIALNLSTEVSTVSFSVCLSDQCNLLEMSGVWGYNSSVWKDVNEPMGLGRVGPKKTETDTHTHTHAHTHTHTHTRTRTRTLPGLVYFNLFKVMKTWMLYVMKTLETKSTIRARKRFLSRKVYIYVIYTLVDIHFRVYAYRNCSRTINYLIIIKHA